MFGLSEWWIILIVVVVLFGGSQIPKLARALGKAKKEFQDGLESGRKDAADKEACPDTDDAKEIDKTS